MHFHGHAHDHNSSGHHDHDHDCDHHHSHGSATDQQKRLRLTLVLVVTYMIAEIIGGWWSNSLALLADAGHMLSDAASLGLSWFAMWLVSRPAGRQRTYGYQRAEIMAALINATTLVGVSGYVLYEAWHRLQAPVPVQGTLMTAIAAGGLLVNIASLFILHGGREHSLNVRGAWLHVLSDTLGSVATLISGVLITFFDWNAADPIISAVIGLLILISAWRLLNESVWILMEGAPSRIEVEAVQQALLAAPGVSAVHDLHVWTIASGMDSLSCHVVSDGTQSWDVLLRALRSIVHDRFGVDHVTIQIEPEGFEEPAICA